MKRLKAIVMGVAVMTACAFVGPMNAQILYKVEKEGCPKVSYLLGTHHFAPLAVIDSISELPGIINGIDKLYGEIEMSQMTDPSVMMGMQQKMVAPADSTLDKIMSPAQLDSLGKVLNEYAGAEVPLNMLYPLKPSVVSTQIAAMLAMKVFPTLAGIEGIDKQMQDRAKAAGKPVDGLETVEFQIDMLYNRPIAEQLEGLLDVVRDPKGEETRAVELSKAYLNHNIEKITDLMLDSEKDDPEAIERMIYARNANWVSKLSKEMADESLLVVVGAGHLPGDRGVLEGLKKAGYKVTPVK